jgi:hypothetical protein
VAGNSQLTYTITASNPAADSYDVYWIAGNVTDAAAIKAAGNKIAGSGASGTISGLNNGQLYSVVTAAKKAGYPDMDSAAAQGTLNIPSSIALSGFNGTNVHTFAAAGTVGTAYDPASRTLTVTITNTSSQDTGALTVEKTAESQTGAFVITQPAAPGGIAGGGTTTFTVRPDAALTAAAYTATIRVNAATAASQIFTVSFTVITGNGNTNGGYNISVSVPGGADFGTLTRPYTQPAARALTITNTGIYNTGALAISAAANFTVSGTTIAAPGITPGSSNTTLTVRPNAGLAAGTYNPTITVTGSNGITASVAVKVIVVNGTTTITALYGSATSTAFGTLTGPYSAPAARTITVKNTGTVNPTGTLSYSVTAGSAGYFTVSTQAAAGLATGASTTFTVRPKVITTSGTYSVTYTIKGAMTAAVTFTASFVVVDNRADYAIVVSGTAQPKIKNQAAVPITNSGGQFNANTPQIITITNTGKNPVTVFFCDTNIINTSNMEQRMSGPLLAFTLNPLTGAKTKTGYYSIANLPVGQSTTVSFSVTNDTEYSFGIFKNSISSSTRIATYTFLGPVTYDASGGSDR